MPRQEFHAPVRIPEEVLTWLEALYPPRCKSRSETLEEHAFYAGKVELVASLRGRQPPSAIAASSGSKSEIDEALEAALAKIEEEDAEEDMR